MGKVGSLILYIILVIIIIIIILLIIRSIVFFNTLNDGTTIITPQQAQQLVRINSVIIVLLIVILVAVIIMWWNDYSKYNRLMLAENRNDKLSKQLMEDKKRERSLRMEIDRLNKENISLKIVPVVEETVTITEPTVLEPFKEIEDYPPALSVEVEKFSNASPPILEDTPVIESIQDVPTQDVPVQQDGDTFYPPPLNPQILPSSPMSNYASVRSIRPTTLNTN